MEDKKTKALIEILVKIYGRGREAQKRGCDAGSEEFESYAEQIKAIS